MPSPRLFIAADHGGYKLASYLVSKLSQSADCTFLTPTHHPGDDYPRVAKRLVVAMKKSPTAVGLAICRSGAGIAIAANKFSGIRAAQAWTPRVAKKIRSDDNANILALGADHVTATSALAITRSFLRTKFSPKPRYVRRLREIRGYEQGRTH